MEAPKLKNNHVPLMPYPLAFEDEGYDYSWYKRQAYEYFDRFMSHGNDARKSVYGAYYYSFDSEMAENGMEKFTYMIAGLLFQIDKGDVNPEHAFMVMKDIEDFEDNEDLQEQFSSEELKLVKKDISVIRKYLSEHPEDIIDE